MTDSIVIDQRLWSRYKVLRDDDLFSEDFTEQMTILLFLKMAGRIAPSIL